MSFPAPRFNVTRFNGVMPKTKFLDSLAPPPPAKDASPKFQRRLASPLRFKDHQTEWANRITQILNEDYCYLDTSMMGTGKTITAIAIAIYFGLKIIGVVPANTISNWEKECRTYGLSDDMFDFISFDSLAGNSIHHTEKYVKRVEHTDSKGNRQTRFDVTEEFRQNVESGVLLIIDEVQKIKNEKTQFHACRALTSAIYSHGGRSRCAFLSGTPFDKPKHCVTFFKLTPFMVSEKTHEYDQSTKTVTLLGVNELIAACLFFNPEETNKILATQDLSNTTKINVFCIELFSKIINNVIGGANKIPEDIYGTDAKNGIYNIHPDFREALKNGIELLSRATRNDNDPDSDKHSLGDVTTALSMIEAAKRWDIARIARQILNSDPRCKLCIGVNFLETVDYLREELKSYGTIKFVGDISQKRRTAIIYDFNSDDMTNRVLIMTTVSGGEGISLHDTTGRHPHHMLINPGYNYIKTAQAAFRTNRVGKKSKTIVRIFYGGDGNSAEPKELSIYKSAQKKNEVVLKAIHKSISEGLNLPGDYEKEIERV